MYDQMTNSDWFNSDLEEFFYTFYPTVEEIEKLYSSRKINNAQYEMLMYWAEENKKGS